MDEGHTIAQLREAFGIFGQRLIGYAPNGCAVAVNYEYRMIVLGLFRKGNRVILKNME
jgi:hypothetical protein